MLQNKYFQLFIFATLLMGSGFVYQEFYRPEGVGGVPSSGRTVEVTMRVLKDKWTWEPEVLRVGAGDKIRLTIFNEDDYDHGFAIDIFGVNRRLFPQRETILEFNASVPGTHSFYCSVPCGDGHYDQIGKIVVSEEDGVTTLFFNNESESSCLPQEHVNATCLN